MKILERIAARLQIEGTAAASGDGQSSAQSQALRQGKSLTRKSGRTILASNVKRDYYEILGVARGATDQEIKSAYRKLALQFHPDRNPNNPDAEEKFKEASEAYAILADSDKRAMYDRFGHAGVGSTGGGGFEGNSVPGFRRDFR